MRLLATAVAVLLLVGATGCGAEKALQDDASCPGESCTADVQERLDALAALDRVTEVQSVERTYGLDRGASRAAVLGARVEDRAGARSVALAALTVLEDWPEHDTGTATVTVDADPEVTVPYLGREELEMPSAQFDACSAAACAEALDEVRTRVGQDYDGIEALRLEVVAGTLQVTARTTPQQVALVAASVRRHLIEVGARVAERADIEVRGDGPLSLTLRLEDGLVCEQPAGTRAACEQRNSEPFANS